MLLNKIFFLHLLNTSSTYAPDLRSVLYKNDQSSTLQDRSKGHTFSLISKDMQASASMLRLMFTIASFLQRRSWTRISRLLLRVANSLHRLGSLLSWARQLTIPLLLFARKCLARSGTIGHSSIMSFRDTFGSDIAISRHDHDENREYLSADITSKSPERAKSTLLFVAPRGTERATLDIDSWITSIIAVDNTRCFPKPR